MGEWIKSHGAFAQWSAGGNEKESTTDQQHG